MKSPSGLRVSCYNDGPAGKRLNGDRFKGDAGFAQTEIWGYLKAAHVNFRLKFGPLNSVTEI